MGCLAVPKCRSARGLDTAIGAGESRGLLGPTNNEGVRGLLLVCAFALLAGSGCAHATPHPAADLQEAADRTIAADSYQVVVSENGQFGERMTFDKRAGMTATLSDHSEARQIGSVLYYRDGGSSEWLTTSAPRSASIVDFGVSALRAAQVSSGVRRTSGGLTFKADGIPMTAAIKGGFIVEIGQTYTAPIAVTRKFNLSRFGRGFPVTAPPAEQTRMALAADCAGGLRGIKSFVCATTLTDTAPAMATTAP